MKSLNYAVAVTGITAVMLIASLQTPAMAAYVKWIGSGAGGSGTNWTTDSNWIDEVGGGHNRPTALTDARLTFGAAGSAVVSSNDAVAKHLIADGNGLGKLQIQTGGILSLTGNAYVGNSSTAEVEHTNGDHVIGGELFIGHYVGSTGTYTFSGGQLSSAANQYVGCTGTGTLTQSAGTNSIGNDLYLGRYSGSSGTYALSGSGQLLPVADEYVGVYGTGQFNHMGGTNTIGSELYIGLYTGSTGTYALSGGELTSVANQYVGMHGHGHVHTYGWIKYRWCLSLPRSVLRLQRHVQP